MIDMSIFCSSLYTAKHIKIFMFNNNVKIINDPLVFQSVKNYVSQL